MTWLHPWAFWFLAGLPLIVLLYLLKVRRQPLTVSTLIFWQRVLEEHRRRALFQRLRHVLSLLLHLLIFALLVIALSRPSFDRFVREGASTIILLDTRARMQAIESDGETRFAKAQRLALRTIGDASPGRQFALATIGPQPSVLMPFSGSERELRDAVQKCAPTDASGDLETALRLADDLLATRQGAKQIVLFTDRAPHPAKNSQTASARPLVVIGVGTSRNNVAITRFATRPLAASPQTSEVFLEVQNFGDETVKANIEFRYDDKLLDVKPVSVPAGEKSTFVFPSLPRPGATARGWLTAQLDVKDALASDHIARALLPPPKQVRVLLVSNGNQFLEKALAADPGVSFEILAPDAVTPAIAGKFDVLVYDATLPARLPSVSALFVGKTPFDQTAAPLENPIVTDIDSTHPTLRLLDLSKAVILRAQSLNLPSPTEDWSYSAPLRSFEHPLLIVGERRAAPRQRVAALGLDLTATDLPLRVAFPLFLTNTIHWLAGSDPEPRLSLRAGETLALANGERVLVEPPIAGSFQPMQNGFYPVDRGGQRDWIAVNTFDAAESDLRIESTTGPSGTRPTAMPAALSLFNGWPLWRWFALTALLLFTAEWFLFHRRQTE